MIKKILNRVKKIPYMKITLRYGVMQNLCFMFPNEYEIKIIDNKAYIESEKLSCNNCGKVIYEEDEIVYGIPMTHIGYCKSCFDAL